jgi:hypothetical protein
MYLAQESLAAIVVASLHRGALLGHYELGAYVVMSNHVHVLLLPKISPSRVMQSLKGATAREANRVLGRAGETFWQAESYDHWVRDEKERKESRRISRTTLSRLGWSSVRRIFVGQAPVNGAPRRVSARQTRVSAPRLPTAYLHKCRNSRHRLKPVPPSGLRLRGEHAGLVGRRTVHPRNRDIV